MEKQNVPNYQVELENLRKEIEILKAENKVLRRFYVKVCNAFSSLAEIDEINTDRFEDCKDVPCGIKSTSIETSPAEEDVYEIISRLLNDNIPEEEKPVDEHIVKELINKYIQE